MTDRRLGRFVAFVVSVVLVAVLVLAYQVQSRNSALHELRALTGRIEQVTGHTEELLREALEARNAPAAAEQRQRITRALTEIDSIKSILCDAVPEHTECQKGNQ